MRPLGDIALASGATIIGAAAAGPGRGLRQALGRWTGNTAVTLGGGLFVAIVLAGLVGPLLSQDPFAQDAANRLIPPAWDEAGTRAHLLGTDGLGRDYLARLLYGARISLLIGFSTVLIAGLFGTVMGIVAAFYGGWVDTLVRFVVTTRLALPVVLVALAVVSIAGASLELLIVLLGLLLWDRFAIVARSSTLTLRRAEFVTAARSVGQSVPLIIAREILPNIANNLVVIATVEIANAMLLEAALSFLGLGVQPPLPSWGLMIAEAKDYLFFTPYLITLPGACLLALVFSINLLGDGIRDVTDPQNRPR